jgi:hypothetical protein
MRLGRRKKAPASPVSPGRAEGGRYTGNGKGNGTGLKTRHYDGG